MENFQDRGVRIRIRFALRGWIRIRSISDRIRNPGHSFLISTGSYTSVLKLHFRALFPLNPYSCQGVEASLRRYDLDIPSSTDSTAVQRAGEKKQPIEDEDPNETLDILAPFK